MKDLYSHGERIITYYQWLVSTGVCLVLGGKRLDHVDVLPMVCKPPCTVVSLQLAQAPAPIIP